MVPKELHSIALLRFLSSSARDRSFPSMSSVFLSSSLVSFLASCADSRLIFLFPSFPHSFTKLSTHPPCIQKIRIHSHISSYLIYNRSVYAHISQFKRKRNISPVLPLYHPSSLLFQTATTVSLLLLLLLLLLSLALIAAAILGAAFNTLYAHCLPLNVAPSIESI